MTKSRNADCAASHAAQGWPGVDGEVETRGRQLRRPQFTSGTGLGLIPFLMGEKLRNSNSGNILLPSGGAEKAQVPAAAGGRNFVQLDVGKHFNVRSNFIH